jgi:hypothetical protein
MTRNLAVMLFAAALAACGGGIDDEQFIGPPYVEDTAPVAAPRPCPVDPSACHPPPFQATRVTIASVARA